MGCASGQRNSTQPIRLNTVTGILKVTIVDAYIEHQTSSFFKMDPYVKMKFSSQQLQTKVVKKGGKEPVFNESFTFHINSCFKSKGRNLELSLWDSNITSDSQIGFGIIDLDPIINFKLSKNQSRCFINYDRKPAGHINIITEFIQEKAIHLSFRFQMSLIRRSTRTFGDQNCHVQVLIGQQLLKTSPSKNTNEVPPTWLKDILSFLVPVSIRTATIKVYDVDTIIGQLQMDLQNLIKATDELEFNEDYYFEGKTRQLAGTLKFHTLVGESPIFSQIKTVHRKPKVTPQQANNPEKNNQTNQKVQKNVEKQQNNIQIQAQQVQIKPSNNQNIPTDLQNNIQKV